MVLINFIVALCNLKVRSVIESKVPKRDKDTMSNLYIVPYNNTIGNMVTNIENIPQ